MCHDGAREDIINCNKCERCYSKEDLPIHGCAKGGKECPICLKSLIDELYGPTCRLIECDHAMH